MADKQLNIEGAIPFHPEEARKRFVDATDGLFAKHDTFLTQIPNPTEFARDKFRKGLRTYVQAGLNRYKFEKSNIIHGQDVTLKNVNKLPSPFDYDKKIDEFEEAMAYIDGKTDSPKGLRGVVISAINERESEEEKAHQANIEIVRPFFLGIGGNREGMRQENEMWEKEKKFLSDCSEVVQNQPDQLRAIPFEQPSRVKTTA